MSLLFKWTSFWRRRWKDFFQWLTNTFSGNSQRGNWRLFRLKNWLFLRPRILKILLSVKTWILLGLGASNLFVLSFVFNVYLQSGGITLYSTAATESLIKRECEEQVDKVMQGRADSQVCRVETRKRHKGAQYKQSMKFKIKKDGAKLVITLVETNLYNRTKHAEKLAADFCENCETNTDLDHNTNLMDVMKEIVSMAESQEEKVTDELNEARDEYERARISERVCKVKHRKCEGYWNEEEKICEEYDTEERLDCKMSKLVRMNPQQKDRYYRDILKDEFWKVALEEEEDPHLLIDYLSRIQANPYHFSLHSQASAGLIKNYVNWRDSYGELESDYHKDILVNQIVRSASNLSTHLGEQGERDFFHLRNGLDKHFDMAGSRLNSVLTQPHTPASHTSTTGHTSTPSAPANQQLLELY